MSAKYLLRWSPFWQLLQAHNRCEVQAFIEGQPLLYRDDLHSLQPWRHCQINCYMEPYRHSANPYDAALQTAPNCEAAHLFLDAPPPCCIAAYNRRRLVTSVVVRCENYSFENSLLRSYWREVTYDSMPSTRRRAASRRSLARFKRTEPLSL